MALIELKDLARHYSQANLNVAALEGVSLSIEAGEFVAVVGPSGSGKSTLMNLLGCLDKPTAGSLRIGGQDVSQLSEDELAALRRDRFGFVFQRYNLLPHLNALENAALPAVYAGQPSAARKNRAEALLLRLGLHIRKDHHPSELSGGQQQRVSLARALMNGGEILLADEPTGGLDSATGDDLLNLVHELNRAGHTVIVVTHDTSVAARAQRVIEVRDGRITKDSGTSAEHRASLVASPTRKLRGSAMRRWMVQLHEAIGSALLALRGNRLRSALSMLGISVGTASVVSILALTDASQKSIESDMRGLFSGRISVWQGNPAIPAGSTPLSFRPNEMDSIRTIGGVKAVSIDRTMQLTGRYGSRDAALFAIGADDQTLSVRHLKIVQGRGFTTLDSANNAQIVVIDEKARRALFRPEQTVLGKTLMLQLNAPAADPSMQDQHLDGAQISEVAIPMTIVGIAAPDTGGLDDFDGGIGQLLLPMTTYSTKLDARIDADTFRVLIDFTVPPAIVRENIIHRLKALHGAEDFSTSNDEEEFQKLKSMLNTMAMQFAGVGAITLLVGGLGVTNVMLVSVSERTREIGIRMAIGARQSDVHLQFLIEAVVLCCLGGLFGVALSWVAARGISAVQPQLDLNVSWTALVAAFVVSSAVGLLFGTLPARRAAALSPVDALSRE